MVTIGSPSIAGTTPADMRAKLTDYFGHQRNALLYLAGAFLVTLLVLAQITWRLSLSGISRGLCGLVAGLIFVTWLVLPYIAALIADSRSTDPLITHFSPIQAAIDSLRMGDLMARSALEDAAGADRYIELAGRLRGHWIMFVSVAATAGTVLLVFNVISYRKVKATFARMAQAPAAGQVPPAGDPAQALAPMIASAGAAVAPLGEVAAQPAAEQAPPPQA
jgi:cytochrome c oxidase assembly factor CtaG